MRYRHACSGADCQSGGLEPVIIDSGAARSAFRRGRTHRARSIQPALKLAPDLLRGDDKFLHDRQTRCSADFAIDLYYLTTHIFLASAFRASSTLRPTAMIDRDGRHISPIFYR